MYVRPYGQRSRANTIASQYPAVESNNSDIDITVDIRAGAHTDYGR